MYYGTGTYADRGAESAEGRDGDGGPDQTDCGRVSRGGLHNVCSVYRQEVHAVHDVKSTSGPHYIVWFTVSFEQFPPGILRFGFTKYY